MKKTVVSLLICFFLMALFAPILSFAAGSTYTVNITFDVSKLHTDKNVVFYLDDKKIKTLSSDSEDMTLTLTEGKHKFQFMSENGKIHSRSTRINFYEDCDYNISITVLDKSISFNEDRLESSSDGTSKTTTTSSKTNTSSSNASQSATTSKEKEQMVWIPTDGGKKFHRVKSCSGMGNPKKVTIEEAKRAGFDYCKKCFK